MKDDEEEFDFDLEASIYITSLIDIDKFMKIRTDAHENEVITSYQIPIGKLFGESVSLKIVIDGRKTK